MAAATTVGVVTVVSPAAADTAVDTAALRAAVTPAGMQQHLEGLRAAATGTPPNRASGTPGYEASAQYVEGVLEEAGYDFTRQYFDFVGFTEPTPASLSVGATTYALGTDFATMEYSGSGDTDGAPLVSVLDNVEPPTAEPSSSAGCEPEDFPAEAVGAVVLIQRGTCDFAVKAENALAAEAVGVIIYNEGQDGRQELLTGTLGERESFDIPVVGASYEAGQRLLGQVGSPVELTTSTAFNPTTTFNVIAERPGGRTDRTVVVGAHLDSIAEGPGINDNGTGTAALLEIAENMPPTTRNHVRFAFWGAEEAGLIGATEYVASLDERQLRDIALNLNFDMLGSPNYGRFVYDGDGSATGTDGPNGSGSIERVFTDYFASQGLATQETAFDGRSDYGPFIDAGIPAGGLFSGAEDIKTPEQQVLFGGEAGVAFDRCYHQECDDLSNVNMTGLHELADGAAHAVLVFAETRSAVNGTAQGNGG
ncbi:MULTISPECIES: M28 family peptidase [unclassified Blastococcus]